MIPLWIHSRDRRPRALLKVCLLAVLLLSPGVSAAAASGPEAQSRVFFDRGQRAYEAGDYEEALELFQEAYKAKPLPGFLFNLGQCHRKLGNHEQSLDFYQRYLDKGVKGPQRKRVRRIMAQVEKKLTAQRLAPPPIAPNPPPPGGTTSLPPGSTPTSAVIPGASSTPGVQGGDDETGTSGTGEGGTDGANGGDGGAEVEPEGAPWWVWPLAGVGAVVVATAGGLIFYFTVLDTQSDLEPATLGPPLDLRH